MILEDILKFYLTYFHLNHLSPQIIFRSPLKTSGDIHSLGHEDPLQKEMATHFTILDWEIPWTEERGGLQTMESQKTGLSD